MPLFIDNLRYLISWGIQSTWSYHSWIVRTMAARHLPSNMTFAKRRKKRAAAGKAIRQGRLLINLPSACNSLIRSESVGGRLRAEREMMESGNQTLDSDVVREYHDYSENIICFLPCGIGLGFMIKVNQTTLSNR